MTVSLVGKSEEALDAKAFARLECLQLSSDVLFSSHLDLASVAGHANDLIDCARTLLRALYLPNQQLVGCDFQDVRTALATMASERVASRAGPNLSFLRLMLDLEPINPVQIRDWIAPLALHRVSLMLIYLEGGAAFQMRHVREIVMAIRALAPAQCFVKYCVERNLERPGQDIVVSICAVRTL